jgi:hypothetical protein
MFWYWRRRRLHCFYYQVEGHIGFGYKLELIGGGFIFHMLTSSWVIHRESPDVGSDDKEQSILSPSSSNKKTSSPAFMVTEKGAILSGQKVTDSLSVIFFILIHHVIFPFSRVSVPYNIRLYSLLSCDFEGVNYWNMGRDR